MITVQKVVIPQNTLPQPITLPAGTEVLTAQMQGISLVMWVKADNLAPASTRTFVLVQTNANMPAGNLMYIATIQNGPSLTWHLFEII